MIVDTTVSKMESQIQKRLERPVIGSIFNVDELRDLPAFDNSFIVDGESLTFDTSSTYTYIVGDANTYTVGNMIWISSSGFSVVTYTT